MCYSEKHPNYDVNITIGKNENPSASRIEPSEPSEPSANLNGNEDESNSVEGPSKGILNNPHDAAYRNTNNDVSKEIDNNTTNPILPAYVYRLGHSDRFAIVGDALLTCAEYFNRLLMPFGELIEKIPILPVNKGFQQAKRKLDSIVYNMIKEHRDDDKKGTETYYIPYYKPKI